MNETKRTNEQMYEQYLVATHRLGRIFTVAVLLLLVAILTYVCLILQPILVCSQSLLTVPLRVVMVLS